ncbi:MAG: ABC transporter ATP-binding protein/permease [Alphaproteobacteria bacterium]|nr:ABC transporter ATP-binding protein/permease [Alphaproteobacteria bacterium]
MAKQAQVKKTSIKKNSDIFSGAPTSLSEIARLVYEYIAPKGDNNLRIRLASLIIALVISKLCAAVIPILYGASVDLLAPLNLDNGIGFSMSLLMLLVGGYALARVGETVFSELKEFLFVKFASKAVRMAALNAFEHLHKLSLQFHLDRQTGGTSRSIDRGAKAMTLLLSTGVFEVIPLFVELIFISGVLWFLFGYEFAVVTFLTVTIYSYFTIKTTEWRIKFRRRMNEADEFAATKTVDSLLNYETVKYFNAEKLESKNYDKALRVYEDAYVLSRTSLTLVNIGQGIIVALGLVALLALSAREIQAGRMSVGDFVVVHTYIIQLALPLEFLGWTYREVRQAIIDLERMFGLMKEMPDIQDPTDAPNIVIKKGEIRFENIGFSYGRGAILDDVSFCVNSGERVALVGPSGGGKSTISRLLFRFYDPQKGRILIDGQDIRDVKQDSVRAAIGMVPQDTVMFNASIGYNIGYGRADATPEEIEKVAKLAAIENFISSLPDGYETLVGERGLKLSGGEKQRVAIARAIIKQPKIFVFDEATSALDSRTEREIQTSLNTISQGQTTLVIAHRLSTIVDADMILVLNQGRIEEKGTHLQLLAQDGLYAAMWKRQSSGFQKNNFDA